MSFDPRKYSDAVQKVSKDTPVEEILYLLKRDGGVFVKNLVSEEDVDQAYQKAKPRLDADTEWNGTFFPAQTQRAPSLIARSPTYTKTQVMNPLFRQVGDHVLTSRRWYWWGEEKKLSLSKPYEENQFRAGLADIARSYDWEIQEYMGYSMREPACGYVEQVDPIYHLRPELEEEERPRDF